MNNNENEKLKGNSVRNLLITLVVAPILVALIAGEKAPWWSGSATREEDSKAPTDQVTEPTPLAETTPVIEPTPSESTPVVEPTPPAAAETTPAVVEPVPAEPKRSTIDESSRPVTVTGTGNTVNDNSVNVSGSQNSVNVTKESEARSRGELDVPNVAGMSYHEAREIILTEGWIPQMQHWSYSKDLNISSGNGPVFWEQGYTEVEACAPTGYADCKFVFADPGGRELVVATRGMEIPDQGIEAQVTNVDLRERRW